MATDPRRGAPASPRQVPGRGTSPARRVTAPRHTRPMPPPGTRPAPRPAGPRARSRAPRMPFILLLVGLLGGALVSLLVISTTLAQGSFRVTSLQEQNADLARQARGGPPASPSPPGPARPPPARPRQPDPAAGHPPARDRLRAVAVRRPAGPAAGHGVG